MILGAIGFCAGSFCRQQTRRFSNVVPRFLLDSANASTRFPQAAAFFKPRLGFKTIAGVGSSLGNTSLIQNAAHIRNYSVNFFGNDSETYKEPTQIVYECDKLGKSPNHHEIEKLLEKYEIAHSHAIPVRNEFMQDEPLSSKDLQNINITEYHRKIAGISDCIAFWTVKFLRIFADAFFRKRYVHRAIVLETVAAVPGMVAGMFRHLKCLRRMQNDNGWIQKLLHEAENERMHLMIWMQVTRPSLLERILVTSVQGASFTFYAMFYVFSPRTAHRMVGYLEEEAIVSYTGFLKEIAHGNIRNTPAPPLAISYYNLAADALLSDAVYAVRADEAAHRDANHHFADRFDSKSDNAPQRQL